MDPHHFDADPDSTYHPDADPDADLYPFNLMRIRIQILASKSAKIGSFHTFWLVICKLMLIRTRYRIQLITDADPDSDFYVMRMRIRMRIQVTKMMRILADLNVDPVPQPCRGPTLYVCYSEHCIYGNLILTLT